MSDSLFESIHSGVTSANDGIANFVRSINGDLEEEDDDYEDDEEGGGEETESCEVENEDGVGKDPNGSLQYSFPDAPSATSIYNPRSDASTVRAQMTPPNVNVVEQNIANTRADINNNMTDSQRNLMRGTVDTPNTLPAGRTTTPSSPRTDQNSPNTRSDLNAMSAEQRQELLQSLLDGSRNNSADRTAADRAQNIERTQRAEGRAGRDRVQYIDSTRDFQTLNTGDRLVRTTQGEVLIMPAAPGEQSGSLYVRRDGSYDLQTSQSVQVTPNRDGSTTMRFANGDTVTFAQGRITAVQRGGMSSVTPPDFNRRQEAPPRTPPAAAHPPAERPPSR